MPAHSVPRCLGGENGFIGRKDFQSPETYWDHEPGQAGRATSPRAPMLECGARRSDRPTEERQRFMGSLDTGFGLRSNRSWVILDAL